MELPRNEKPFRGPGGTPGGIGEFLLGLGMTLAGAYLITASVTVSTGYWRIWGHDASGLSLVPLILGTGLVFFNGKSLLGWALLVGAVIIIVSGILLNLHFYFQPTSLFNTLMMLILLAGGVGLIARSLRPH